MISQIYCTGKSSNEGKLYPIISGIGCQACSLELEACSFFLFLIFLDHFLLNAEMAKTPPVSGFRGRPSVGYRQAPPLLC